MSALVQKFFRNPKLFLILLIPLIITFRLFTLNNIEFKADEALFVYLTNQLYANSHFVSTGIPSSTGIQNFPLFNYFLYIIGFFSQNPIYLSLIIASLNCISVIGFYFFLKKHFNTFIANSASLLLAVSPWNILLSRKIWPQDVIIILVIGFFYFLFNYFENKKAKNIFWSFLILSLLFQLHGSGIFFAIATAIIFLLQKIRLPLKHASLGFITGLLPGLPFIIYQVFPDPFCPDCIRFIEFQSIPKVFDFFNFTRPFIFLGSLEFITILGEDFQIFISKNPVIDLFNLITYLFYIFCILSSIFLIFKLKDKRKIFSNLKMLIISLYIFIIPTLYFLTRTPSYFHYFVIISPLLFILIGFILNKVSAVTPRAKFVTLLIISLFLFSNIAFNFSFYKFINITKDISGDYGSIFPLTDNLTNEYLIQYKSLPYYDELKYYTYIFIRTPQLNTRTAEFFLKKGDLDLAEVELTKAISKDPNDLQALTNLTYIYIQKGEFKKAEEGILNLKMKDATSSAQLKYLLNQSMQYGR